ncbi:hypothetical protein FDP41_005287 [Naegleria fowleri]|uniref:ADP-ribosylhydrolase ARH1 n=1 Tax=Naegleria fowleri TaxID=5763 RepID=A0A6A5BPY2_NAEFO|nr:uncharacterized protein FDP41_005287 [Naegleria fowleri]KAF0975960.1 hypothetical protein FDP41_005287 [Naegleria fowleri]CAG4708067.1 unnamed protein product [Naegleria fowleri]
MISSQETSSSTQPSADLAERFLAAVILGAVGDAIGYRNGSWEFNTDGESIHYELKKYYGSLAGIDVKGWRVSDDTVMHLASLRALNTFMKHQQQQQLTLHNPKLIYSFDEKDPNSCQEFMKQFVDPLMQEMSKEYIICWDDMGGRAPGPTCGKGVRFLESKGVDKWQLYPYDSRGGGCGGSMRAMMIGALYGPQRRDMLIAASVESGRLTHNHPNGFLGALVSALFTAYALEKTIPPAQWGVMFLYDIMPRTKIYLEKVAMRDWQVMESEITKFEQKFAQYLKERSLYLDEQVVKLALSAQHKSPETLSNEEKHALQQVTYLQPQFPKEYGIQERDDFYRKWSFSGWAGASGDDSCIIAYDSILFAGPNNYEVMMLHSALHAGDSDSTGTIAAAWYGAMYGFNNVFKKNWENIEKKQEMTDLAASLYELYKL